MYLFRTAAGVMIYGDKANSVYQGNLWICPTSGNNVELRNPDGSIFRNEFDITTVYKNADDELYANIEEFNAVSGTFFFRVGANGFGVTRITGTGVTDYAAPSDLKVGSAIFALNPADVEVSSLTVSDIATIRFTVAPEVGDFPLVIYTKK